MIDHTGVLVSDFEKSKRFYQQALAPIGYAMLSEFPAAVTGHTDVAGFGAQGTSDFWISRGVSARRRHPRASSPLIRRRQASSDAVEARRCRRLDA